MSNVEIISTEAMLKGIEYTGENLNTYAEWLKMGMQVQKGQKAIIQTSLWKPVTFKDKETKESKSKIILVKASLFSVEQVAPIENKELN